MGMFSRPAPTAATDPEEVRARVDGIAALMRSRLGAHGTSLRETLHHSGHELPEAVLSEAAYLSDCAELAGHPRLIQRVDPRRLAEAEDTCRTHLEAVSRWSRRWAAAAAVLRRLVVVVLATAALALGLALWRGLL